MTSRRPASTTSRWSTTSTRSSPSERLQAEALGRLSEQPEAPSYSANDDKRRRLQPEVMFVGIARGKEIIFDTFTPAKKAAFREAMAKEWSRWQQLKATIPVSADMLQELSADLHADRRHAVGLHREGERSR